MSKALAIVQEQDVEQAPWYEALVDECKAIVVEAEFNSRWALVEGYHALGSRIIDDAQFESYAKGNKSSVQGLARNIGVSERVLYYAIQFARRYPKLDRVPEGKAISWNKLITKYLPAPTETERTNWEELAWTCSADEAQIIQWIMRLYNGGQRFDLDPTFSVGRIWQGLPRPVHCGDLEPQTEACQAMDSRRLPFADCELRSIFFDPPFIAKNVDRENGSLGIIESRFGGYKTIDDLWRFYSESLTEFYRVLAPEGIVAFKIQDCVSGGRQHWSHSFVMWTALELGFVIEDLFVLGPKQEMPPRGIQQHAKKNHDFFIVLRKVEETE